MKYGIPFIRPFTSPFGAPFFGIGSTGPQEPTGFVAKYTSYLVDNFTLVTGDSVNVWADESVNNNDLTQATSANQPKLVEDFTVTQFTASNQPTLVDDAGTWKLDFDGNDYMEGLKPQSGDFTYVFTGLNMVVSGGQVLISNSSSTSNFRVDLSGILKFRGDDNVSLDFSATILSDIVGELVFKRTGDDYSTYINGIKFGNTITNTANFEIDRLGLSSASINGSLQSLEIYDVAVADVNNITETPVQSLTADPLKMRTSANANPTDGQDVAKWYADEFSAYRDARVVFDDANDVMNGLPVQTGDFTYIFKSNVTGIGNAEYILSGSDSSALLLLSDGYFYLRQSTSVSDQIFGSEVVQTGDSVYTLVREGDDVRWYVDSILKDTVDVTGRSFNFTNYGRSTNSKGTEDSFLNVFDRALTQEEINYYSYLRSETGDILLPPLLPIAAVNSMGLLATSDYALGTKSVPLQTDSNQTWSMRVFVPSSAPPQNHLVFALNRLAPVARTSRITLTLLGPTTLSVDYYNHPTVGSNSDNESIISSPINKDEWNHILVTMDVTGTGLATLYVNNVQQGTADVSLGIGNDPLLDLGIGTYHTSFGSDLNGYINNLRIWDRALTPAEVATEWNNSASEFLCYGSAVSGSTLSADLIDNSLTDDSGNSTITAVGTPTYTNQGMIKLC